MSLSICLCVILFEIKYEFCFVLLISWQGNPPAKVQNSNSANRFLLHISHRLYKGPTFNFVLSTLIFNFVVPEFKSYGLRQFLPSLTGLFSSILGLDPTVPSFEVWSVQFLCKTKPVDTSFETTNCFERCLGKKLHLSLLCFLAAVVWKQIAGPSHRTR